MSYICSSIADIVIILPESGDRGVDSDVEHNNDEQLDKNSFPSDVTGELEVHHEDSDSEEKETESVLSKKMQKVDTPKWKKSDRVALPLSPSPPPKLEKNI